eukprot:CAMPEP_0202481982 /NCGR_PEP_ID=MMETSP1361-20130828/1447_1 /ASSEMBLY_ACC=CAM_ASM_000849 /TAXON_ID=210615 /ORGANISM="Staurosira complex sp., Strain CCMP2646" /LENGTH=58 /DNA_ID=CAMNT_0049109669 /DNA_START=476 /DNA_END=652 /DNA_ORIENTATION=+
MKMGMNNTDSHCKYKDKNGVPLPEIDEWELVGHQLGTPYQTNGCDCGIFTCMFAAFLS